MKRLTSFSRQFAWLLLLVLLISPIIVMSGCALFDDDGRMQAAKDIRVAEENTKQEVLKTRQAEINAKQNKDGKRNPTVKTTAYDKNGKVVAVTEVDLQPALAEMGLNKGGKGDTYGVELTTTPLPKGQTAETIEAGTGLVAEVGGAPATIIHATGKGIGRALKETGGGTKINGQEINIQDSLNRSESVAIGSNNAVTGALTTDKSQKSELAQQEAAGAVQQ